MFGLVRFLLFHCFYNMQYQSWLDLANFCCCGKMARRWLRSWPRTKTNTTKETGDFQRSSDHLSSMQAIKFLDQTDKDPSGSLKTRWYQEKWQGTYEWFVLFRSFNVLSKWNAWFCPREFYRPENLWGLCDSVCACSDLPLQVPLMLAKYSIIELTFDWRPCVFISHAENQSKSLQGIL